jgi:hypothetical protein
MHCILASLNIISSSHISGALPSITDQMSLFSISSPSSCLAALFELVEVKKMLSHIPIGISSYSKKNLNLTLFLIKGWSVGRAELA